MTYLLYVIILINVLNFSICLILNIIVLNVHCTIEFPSDTIPFLDVEIKLNQTGIDTWVYRKATNINLILNFNALCPIKWNSRLILCFLNQA